MLIYDGIMSQETSALMAEKLYEEAFSIFFNWQKILPENVYRYHELICQETNAPVDLQMATVLPFVGSCLGPTMKDLFLTWKTALNLFWIVEGASGAGKSMSRKCFISDPLEYIMNNKKVNVKDFEISKFTRAGKYLM